MCGTIDERMGLATPLPKIYTWLDTVGFGHLKPEDRPDATTRMAAAANAKKE